MTKTYNRRPLQFDTPDSSDIKSYFFNTTEFKGKIEDKNFMAVDQNSYEDCNNVYVDTEGLLRSRPAIKYSKHTISVPAGATNTFDGTGIIDTYTFADLSSTFIVYLTLVSNTYHLIFINNDTLQLDYTITDSGVTGKDKLKLHLVNGKIFIFMPNSFMYYDVENKTVNNATDFIYIPKTTVDKAGVISSAEDTNEFTTSEIITYLYSSDTGITSEVIDKTCKVEIDGVTYSIVFNSLTAPTIVKNVMSTVGLNDIVEVCDANDYFAIYRYATNMVEIYSDEQKFVAQYDFSQYHSTASSFIGSMHFSQDGNYLIVIERVSDGDGHYSSVTPYIVSIAADTGSTTLRFTSFTSVSSYVEDYSSTSTLPPVTSGDTIINIVYDFITYDRFACCYNIYETSVDDDIYAIYYTYEDDTWTTSTRDTFVTSLLYKAYSTKNVPLPTIKFVYNYLYYTGSYTPANSIAVIVSTVHYYYDTNPTSYTGVLKFVSFNKDTSDNISSFDRYIDNFLSNRVDCMGCYADIKFDGVQLGIAHVNDDNVGSHYVEILTYNEANWYLLNDYVGNSNQYKSKLSLSKQSVILYYSITGSQAYSSTSLWYYYRGVRYDLLTNITSSTNLNFVPVGFTDYIYYLVKGTSYSTLYTNKGIEDFPVNYTKTGTINYFVPSHIDSTTNIYVSNGKDLYITSYRENSNYEFMWYFPYSNTYTYDGPITNLHAISSSEMAVFLSNSVHYVTYDSDLSAYRYYKTKLQVGTREGDDITTSYDGTYTIFPTERGIVAMSYQQFVSSTDQALTYLSDNIFDVIKQYYIDTMSVGIKIVKYDYWLIIYATNKHNGFIFDMRNSSWWPVSLHYINDNSYKPSKVYTYDNSIKMLIGTNRYLFDKANLEYYDLYTSDTKKPTLVEWYLVSPKLHLSAFNYYKHIVNLTLNTVEYLDDDYTKYDVSFNLYVANYRLDNGHDWLGNKIDTGYFDTPSGDTDVSVITYKVDQICTFVKRVNFAAVAQFQYELEYNKKAINPLPLSFSGISIKYKIGSEVR